LHLRERARVNGKDTRGLHKNKREKQDIRQEREHQGTSESGVWNVQKPSLDLCVSIFRRFAVLQLMLEFSVKASELERSALNLRLIQFVPVRPGSSRLVPSRSGSSQVVLGRLAVKPSRPSEVLKFSYIRTAADGSPHAGRNTAIYKRRLLFSTFTVHAVLIHMSKTLLLRVSSRAFSLSTAAVREFSKSGLVRIDAFHTDLQR
jgi:hypothetical protein